MEDIREGEDKGQREDIPDIIPLRYHVLREFAPVS